MIFVDLSDVKDLERFILFWLKSNDELENDDVWILFW